MREDMYQNPGIKIVFGPVRSAIYDLANNSVFSVNKEGSEVLKRIHANKISEKDIGFLEKLIERGFYSRSPYSKQNNYYNIENTKEFVWLEITQNCNLKCIHCYGDFNVSKSKTFSFNTWKKIILDIYENGFNSIQFIGGEPHLEQQLLIKLIDFSRNQGFQFIEVFTNLTILNEYIIKCYKTNDVRVAFSIYSHIPQVHDSITQTKNSFYNLRKNLITIVENDIDARSALIAFPQNISHINKTMEKLKVIGFNINGYEFVRPVGRAKNIVFENAEFEKKATFTEPIFNTDFSSFKRSLKYNSCWAGKLLITSDGLVYPCVMSRNEKIGDLKEDSFEKIISKAQTKNFWELSKDHVKICSECEYRYACLDCRPLAESLTGDKFSKNPRCTYDPHRGIWN